MNDKIAVDQDTPAAEINSQNDRSSAIGRSFLRAVRFYTYNTPISKGKYRIYLAALDLVKERPRSLETTVKDGRKFYVDLSTGMQETVFFIGEYEKPITAITEHLVQKGATCIDVGANFGWYSTKLSQLAGAEGQVHSFEPVPQTFAELKRNVSLSPNSRKIFINNLALGDKEGTVKINLFEGEPTGHASLSNETDGNFSAFECRMTTLNDYLTEKVIGDVDFVKVDIEGAEMLFLKGADKLFSQTVPPIVLMEMAKDTLEPFGSVPDDLIKFIGSKAEYDFYEIDEPNGRLIEIEGFAKDDIGANVFCIPKNAGQNVKSSIKRFLK